MARYNRISRKKKEHEALLSNTTDRVRQWLSEKSGTLIIGAFVAALLSVIVYGVVFYKTTRFDRANNMLYAALKMAPEKGARAAQAGAAISALDELANSGTPDNVTARARLTAASLYMRKKDYANADKQYKLAADVSEPGSLLHESALAGQASALEMAGKHAQAGKIYSGLSVTSVYFPRSSALTGLAYAKVADGDSSGAVKALKQLEAEHPNDYPPAKISGIIRLIENGELSRALTALKNVPSHSAPKPAGKGGIVQEGEIHSGAVENR